MGRTCSTNSGGEECREIQEGRDNWEDQDVGGWAILRWILREIGWDGMDWIDLARDRDQWRDLVNAVMNLRVP
jgi:hypothetical protein